MKDVREIRKQKAQETLDILEKGHYQVESHTISIKQQITTSINNTKLYEPEQFNHLLDQAAMKIDNMAHQTNILVRNCTTMEAATSLLENHHKIACLNFASAKNPGGGFLNGAQAQEESLARASSLYPTQMKYFSQMYEYNRNRTGKTYLYSDYMIYSPDTVFFKDDKDGLLSEPYLMDVLTSPAVNVGAIKNNKPEEQCLVEQTMRSRIDKILAVFLMNGVEDLILGAWGCGVFRNEPEQIADYFAYFLKDNGKYARCFRNIIFAVYARRKETNNIIAFENIFKNN